MRNAQSQRTSRPFPSAQAAVGLFLADLLGLTRQAHASLVVALFEAPQSVREALGAVRQPLRLLGNDPPSAALHPLLPLVEAGGGSREVVLVVVLKRLISVPLEHQKADASWAVWPRLSHQTHSKMMQNDIYKMIL